LSLDSKIYRISEEEHEEKNFQILGQNQFC